MVDKLTPTQTKELADRRLITDVLTPAQLRSLRAKPFPERNKIVQDKLNMIDRSRAKRNDEARQKRIRELRRNEKFIF